MKLSFTGCIFFLLLNIGISVAEEMHLPPYTGSLAFESMKSLAGSWEGIHTMG